ncbi:MAG: DUF3943 domain-containing protein [Endomicrobia bacterium]|nr:DUF3943 domain-containing protein [Endomicrobiia bacterium]
MRAILCKKIIILLILFSCFTNVFAQSLYANSSVIASESSETSKYAPLIALSQVVGINVFVHLFDRFVLRADYAQVNMSDISNNFSKGFVWDNDGFLMNNFLHPFHGSLYFNSARANGLSFWQSVPYTFIGSFMWEFFGENTEPSINDFMATSIGGIALGEVAHRVSFIIRDDSKHGLERIGREILAGIISPMDLFNRLITGKAWRHSLDEKEQRDYHREKFHMDLYVFNRYMIDLDKNRDRSNMALGFSAIYGDPFSEEKERLPYDFFIADINFNVIGNQPVVTEASIIGALWGKQWEKEPRTIFAGVFQHFDYYDSNPFAENAPKPYNFSAPAALGGGIYVKKQKNENELPVFYGSFHANLVLLGAIESDHYHVYHRDYNFGMGYGFKLSALMNFSKYINAFVNLKTYQIFTMNNSEEELYYSIYDEYDAMGNKGNTFFSILSAGFGYRINDNIRISLEQRFFSRQTSYKFFKEVSTNSTETRLKLTYSIFN